MWRACRLVIDTGIHQFGWTREQAMSYLRDRAPLAEHEITTEIDRYIAWPGQALAYKLGELQIRRHRREAEEKLGAKFDQRRFHDAILAHRLGAAAGAGAAHGAVHRRRERCKEGVVHPPSANISHGQLHTRRRRYRRRVHRVTP